eukprot:4670452-Pyramimonas_sp.AAC.1
MRVSKLLCRPQLCPPDACLSHLFRESGMKLTSGPRNAISYNIATKLEAIGFPTEFIDLNAVSRAAAMRYYIKSGGLH